jgi:alpha-tubulin suppressor-like RCC1 family protein
MRRLLALVALLLLGLAEPAAARTPTTDWRQLSAGAEHTCGIRTTGRLSCWGGNSYGELGAGNADPQAGMVGVATGFSDWTQVTAGNGSTCALRATGRRYCWGLNDRGQLGLGAPVPSYTPTSLSGEADTWRTIDLGTTSACGVRRTGRLFCWGSNEYGQLGNGTDDDAQAPVQVAGGRTDWTQVSVGDSFACAVRRDHRLFCWGFNATGQLGADVDLFTTRPVEVAGRRTDWASVSAGGIHTCGLRTSGRLFCWGYGDTGQLGDGRSLGSPTPVQVLGGRTDWDRVTVGGQFSCARRRSGRLFCWGGDGEGELGDGLPAAMRNRPTEVAGHADDWANVTATTLHACAVTRTGRAYCWGFGPNGQLGGGGPDLRVEPTAVRL